MSGIRTSHVFADRATGYQSYQDTTQQASDAYLHNKQNTDTQIGATSPSASSLVKKYGPSKNDFAALTTGMSTLSPAPEAQPGEDSTVSSTISGAASGAMAGMAFGPWGAVAGGVIGGAIGFFKGRKSKKEGEKALKRREEEEKLYASAKRGAQRQYGANRTANFMEQANSLYGGTGKTIGIARRGGIVYAPIQLAIYNTNVPTKRIDMPITSEMIRKASSGAKVELQEKVMLCSRADGSCSLRNRSEVDTPIFRRGGSVVNKLKENIIPHGVLHEEENNTGVKGDKGLPIVDNGAKMFELEKSEWVLNANVSKGIETSVAKYLQAPSEDILLEIGKTIYDEIHLNTYSYDKNYSHLNH